MCSLGTMGDCDLSSLKVKLEASVAQLMKTLSEVLAGMQKGFAVERAARIEAERQRAELQCKFNAVTQQVGETESRGQKHEAELRRLTDMMKKQQEALNMLSQKVDQLPLPVQRSAVEDAVVNSPSLELKPDVSTLCDNSLTSPNCLDAGQPNTQTLGTECSVSDLHILDTFAADPSSDIKPHLSPECDDETVAYSECDDLNPSIAGPSNGQMSEGNRIAFDDKLNRRTSVFLEKMHVTTTTRMSEVNEESRHYSADAVMTDLHDTADVTPDMPELTGMKYEYETDQIINVDSDTDSIVQPSTTMMTASATVNNDISKKKRFTCTQCQRQFCFKSTLKQHVEYTHLGLRNHVCDICQKAYLNKQDLQRHMLIHTGEKPYKCKYCDKRMSYRNMLVKHERTHSASHRALLRRMFVHTGEKPYKCRYCDKRVSYRNALAKHERTHSESRGVTLACADCGKSFRSKQGLYYHMHQHTLRKKTLL